MEQDKKQSYAAVPSKEAYFNDFIISFVFWKDNNSEAIQ
jgi:hypothetical protein